MKPYDADLQLHGPYASGVSKHVSIPLLAEQSRKKGLQLLTTGDIQHKDWVTHVRAYLIETENGVYMDSKQQTYFIIGTEVEDCYRIHHLVYLPSLESAVAWRESIAGFGALDCSLCGRPRLRLTPLQIAQRVRDCGGICGPAHSFTPYTGLFSKFDSLTAAYEDETRRIPFLELGLSADTDLADTIESNHQFAFLSSSDAHCVHPTTLISMSNGELVPIEKIEKPECLSLDFHTGTVSGSVPFVVMKKKAPPRLYHIECKTKQVKATPEHRFFVFERERITEKFASDLKEGDLVATLSRIPFGKKLKTVQARLKSKYLKISPEGLFYLKNTRTKNQLTCTHVETKIGLPNDYLWRLEKGRYKMKESTLNSLLDCYQIKKKTFIKQFDVKEDSPIRFPAQTNFGLCQLIGYVLGDGGQNIGRKGRQLGLTDKNDVLLIAYKNLFESQFGVQGQIKPYSKRRSFGIRFNSQILDFVKQNFPTIICPSSKRTVPSFVFDLPEKETGAFLRGYFDAEGSVGNHHIDACSSNDFLLKQIQNLLLKFGIESSLRRNLWEKTKKKFRHRLYITDNRNLRTFLDRIGFASELKTQAVKKYLKTLKGINKSGPIEYLPIEKDIAQLLTKSGIQKAKYGLDRFLYRKEKLRKKTAQKLVAILEKDLQKKPISNDVAAMLKKLKTLAFSDISWHPIRKIDRVPADCEYVYDLNVPGYENYIAEGFIVHNSAWPHRLGREFNRIRLKKPSFSELVNALEDRTSGRIEFNAGLHPSEGKYHKTACNQCFLQFPFEQARDVFHWKCPNCAGQLKKGVADRIGELANVPIGTHPSFRPPYRHLLPLAEIIQQTCGVQNVLSKQVQSRWADMIERFGNEIAILLDVPLDDLATFDKPISEYIAAVRNDWVVFRPGGGGQYGTPVICLSEKALFETREQLLQEAIAQNRFLGQQTLGKY